MHHLTYPARHIVYAGGMTGVKEAMQGKEMKAKTRSTWPEPATTRCTDYNLPCDDRCRDGYSIIVVPSVSRLKI